MKYKTIYNFDNFDNAIDVAQSAVDEYNAGNYDDIDTAIFEEVDRALIYYDEQWQIIMHYQTPVEANLNEAIQQFIEEVQSIVEEDNDNDK